MAAASAEKSAKQRNKSVSGLESSEKRVQKRHQIRQRQRVVAATIYVNAVIPVILCHRAMYLYVKHQLTWRRKSEGIMA